MRYCKNLPNERNPIMHRASVNFLLVIYSFKPWGYSCLYVVVERNARKYHYHEVKKPPANSAITLEELGIYGRPATQIFMNTRDCKTLIDKKFDRKMQLLSSFHLISSISLAPTQQAARGRGGCRLWHTEC
jgi:hypothetical protein